MTLTQIPNLDFPVGAIIIWSGSDKNVPAGQEICDGKNGTPNLSGLFPRGVDDNNPVGKVGGNKTHTHAFEVNATVSYQTRKADGNDWSVIDTNAPVKVNYNGKTKETESLPPFFSRRFIIKQSIQ